MKLAFNILQIVVPFWVSIQICLKLLLNHPSTVLSESLDVTAMEFCFIPTKQKLLQTKLNVLLLLNGKI